MLSTFLAGGKKARPERPDSQEKPLQSWKEIAAYLERDERTARRWEKEEGLPVRRHCEDKRSSVYAYQSEIDAWRMERQPRSEQKVPARWIVPAAIGGFGVLLAIWLIKYSPILNPPNPLVEAADGITLRQVWVGSEVESSGRPSPDGRYLTYVVEPAGNLGVRELATDKARLLTSDAGWTESAYYSVFSPEGTRVAYEWGRWETELRVVDVNGSVPQTLYPSDSGYWLEPADWSSDGRLILVRRCSGDQPDLYQIAIVSADDKSLRILKTVNSGEKINLWFSPDAGHVAYDLSSRETPRDRDIAVLKLADGSEWPLVEYPGDDYILGWLPDGGSVLFASRRSGSYDAWVVPVADGRPSGDPVPVKRNIGRIQPMGFVQDGAFFYEQSGGDWDTDIYTVEIDFEDGLLLSEPLVLVHQHLGNNWSLEWSPEGDSWAYASKDPESKSSLLVVRNLENGKEKQMKVGLSGLGQLHWSPDGGSVLAAGTTAEGTRGWFILDPGTGGLQPVPIPGRSGAVFDAQWFPDGRRILYGRNDVPEQLAQVVLLDLHTRQEEEMLRLEGEGLLGFLALSPDGKELAYTQWIHDPEETPELISLRKKPLRGGEETEIFAVEFPEMIGHITWSHDGRFIVFGRTFLGGPDPRRTVLWKVSSASGTPEKLGALGNLATREPIRVHPTGDRVAFTSAKKRAEIWVMEGLTVMEGSFN